MQLHQGHELDSAVHCCRHAPGPRHRPPRLACTARTVSLMFPPFWLTRLGNIHAPFREAATLGFVRILNPQCLPVSKHPFVHTFDQPKSYTYSDIILHDTIPSMFRAEAKGVECLEKEAACVLRHYLRPAALTRPNSWLGQLSFLYPPIAVQATLSMEWWRVISQRRRAKSSDYYEFQQPSWC